MNRKIIPTLILICTLNWAFAARGQLVLSGTNYLQDFNSLAGGLPAGWTVRTNATATSLGTSINFLTIAKSWGDAPGEFGNCASIISNAGTNFIGTESPSIQAACTNRALAIRQTASFGDPGAAFVLEITNTVGLANLNLSVTLEMLRINAFSTTWRVEYGIGNPPASFNLLGTYSDPGIFGVTNRAFNLGTDANNQASNLCIRIVALAAASGTTGSRDTFGIDNFSLSWSLLPTNPPVIRNLSTASGYVAIDFEGESCDSTNSFLLQATASLAGGFTNTDATISQTAPGRFQAVCGCGGAQQFYRLKRR